MIKGIAFVKALADRGHHIEVVTGFPNYPIGKIYPGYRLRLYQREVLEDITVHRLALYPSHDGSSIRRILNYLSFSLSAALFCAVQARRFDVIYAYPPITVGLAAAVAGGVARRPFVLDIQDLWPDSVVKSGMRGTARMTGVLSAICNFVYRCSARILAQSRGIKARIVERGVPADKVDVVYNWADEQAAAPSGSCDLTRFGFEGGFNIVYGGNLGRVQGLDTLVRAAHQARDRVPDLKLLLIGDGIESGSLRALVQDLGATNVRIEPGVPRTQIGDIFHAGDVLALHLWDDPLFAITIPQKTQFYMAMGKPVLIGVRGEAASFIEQAGAGVSVPPQDVDAMANAMVELANLPKAALAEMGRRGRAAYLKDFSFHSAIDATEALLHAAVRSSGDR